MSEQLIDAAKAPIIAYNNKDWNAVKRAVSGKLRGYTFSSASSPTSRMGSRALQPDARRGPVRRHGRCDVRLCRREDGPA
jgi:hypothetical protein